MAKTVQPSINETAFNCPHCGALTTQYWYDIYADRIKGNGTPFLFYETEDKIKELIRKIEDAEEKRATLDYLMKLRNRDVFFHHCDGASYSHLRIENTSISRCYNCDKIGIWINDKLLYPIEGHGPEANEDLPIDILADYAEASNILAISPRGAAALLRLSIQKLCVFLGEPGKNLNADIGSLVKKGLDIRVQKSLDVVRVIGNHAVHPGQIDLKDDRNTAIKLFALVNLIAEKMITQEKHVKELYDGLPDAAKEQITKRDGSKTV